MEIKFFDDLSHIANRRPPEEVRITDLSFAAAGSDKRRVAVAFEITPFLERPSLDITITNDHGQKAGSLTVIEALQPAFSLTIHLRDAQPTERYHARAELYYRSLEKGRVAVHELTRSFTL